MHPNSTTALTLQYSTRALPMPGISWYQQMALLVVNHTLTQAEAVRHLKAAGFTTREETRRLYRYIAQMQH